MMVHQPFLSEAEKLFKKLLYIEPLFSLGTAHRWSLFPFRRGNAVYSQQGIAENTIEITGFERYLNLPLEYVLSLALP